MCAAATDRSRATSGGGGRVTRMRPDEAGRYSLCGAASTGRRTRRTKRTHRVRRVTDLTVQYLYVRGRPIASVSELQNLVYEVPEHAALPLVITHWIARTEV